MTVCDQLIAVVQRFGPRPVPAGWIAQDPSLAVHADLAGLIRAVRAYQDPPQSDAAIRSLLALDPTGQLDPRVVLLAALAPIHLTGIRGKGAPAEEALAELTLVLCDTGNLDGLDHLLRRLLHRAIRRWERRRNQHEAQRERTLLVAPEDRAFERPARDDTATLAVDRVTLAALRASVDRSVAAGAFTTTVWKNYAAGVLAPALGHPPQRRRNLTRERRLLTRHIDRELAA